MDLKVGLFQKQTMKLSMTQELRQAITLLQYSSQELTAFLEETALDNPFIQLDYSNISPASKGTNTQQQDQFQWIESKPSLTDYLLHQIMIQKVFMSDKKILTFLIYSLDENGYLTATYEDTLEHFAGLTREEWCQSVSVIQELEPTGIGSRSLQECLLLQMRKNHYADDAIRIIQQFFHEFADKKWQKIATALSITLEHIQSYADEIQTLNPKPASVFRKETSTYVTPDFIVLEDRGNFKVKLVDDSVPSVSFQQSDYNQFKKKGDATARHYLEKKEGDYHWLVKSLNSRRVTLKKVIEVILKKQAIFFRKGPLQPMTMKEIAEEIDMHESTVSRAVKGKYIQTPSGTLSLKSLFSQNIKGQDSETSHHIKETIRGMITTEDKRSPLSDQKLVEMLQDKQMFVSRRTVAKYRDQLGILSSMRRKQFR